MTIAPGRFCFMVMPFGRKPSQADAGKGPAEIDCNALWDKAFYPLLTELGYQAIRADQETGALIINQMLERLYFSDLVIADLTIPNGNVYYEIGIRHAAKQSGCVLVAADWSKALFDVAQMRALRYPLPNGDIDEETARGIQDALRPHIEKMKNGTSPMYDLLPGYPGPVDPRRASGVRDQAAALAAFQGELRAVRAMPITLQIQAAKALATKYPAGIAPPVIAIGVVRALADAPANVADWQDVLTYIEALDGNVATEPYLCEQRALALGKVGRPMDAIAALLALIDVAGDSSERQGLLGGRFKELMNAAKAAGRPAAEVADCLSQAIAHYERGMLLDLNDYYPTSNLPRLYRLRGEEGDQSRAETALQVTSAACERALARGSTDEWIRPTLLGVAFDLADVRKAEEAAAKVRLEGARAWKLDTTLDNLAISLGHVADPATHERLAAILADLRRLNERGPQGR